MKTSFLRASGALVLGFLIFSSFLLGETAPSFPALDETTRLMQEYMARRAEWLELRQSALEQARTARNEQEKKQRLERLAGDEKPLLSRMASAAQAYRAAAQQKRSQAQAAATAAKTRS
jgi:hypothetical protein